MSYLILDETNKIVGEKKTEKEAKQWVKYRPELRYEEFTQEVNNEPCALDDIFNCF